MPEGMSEAALKALAEDAAERSAKKALARTFRLLGVDICDQRSVNDLRADIVWAHEERKRDARGELRRERTPLKLVVATISAVAIAAAALLKEIFLPLLSLGVGS